MKPRSTLTITMIAATTLVACGSSDQQAVDTPAAATTIEGAEFFDDLALPTSRPAGLSFVRIEQYADPEVDGQRVQLVFGKDLASDTVYVCTRGVDATDKHGTACPYPGKEVVRVVAGEHSETVYAVDTHDPQTTAKGGTAQARAEIADLLADVPTSSSPAWFVQSIEQEGL